MKRLLYIACLFLATLVLPATAEIIGVEQFDYPDSNIAAKNGGTFWDYKNTAPVGHTGTASNWDSPVGTPTVTNGGLVTSGNSVAKREYRGANETEGAVNGANVAKTVYYRVTVTTGATVGTGDYFGISSMDFNSEKIYFGKRGGSTTWGVEEVGVSGTDGSLTILPNTTYLLVAQLDFPGDAIRLWVNPDLNAAQNAAINNNAQTSNRIYTGTNWSTAVRFASGGAVTWDDLVVATTWEDLGTIVTTTADEDDGSLGGSTGISLREAVKYSPTGTLITFAPGLSGGTIALDPAKGLMQHPQSALTIDAGALSGGLTLDGGNAAKHFEVQPGRTLTLRRLTLTRGIGSDTVAGSIYNGGTLNLHRCILTGNASTVDGGAIFSAGTLRATDCTLTGNAATFTGGAIFLQSGTLQATGCTLSGNIASDGGAIFQQGGTTATLSHCTIAGNRSTGGFSTGGIAALDGTLTLDHCTISQNTGSGFGGGLSLQTPATVNVNFCIIAANIDLGGNRPDVNKLNNLATLNATGNSLIGNNTSIEAQFPAGTFVGTQSAPLDPKLSPLGSFGGPTQTLHPLIGSPAIDAAGTINPGGTDARGFPRFVDGDASGFEQLDIGAVEAGPLTTVDIISDPGDSTALRSRLAAAAGTPGARIGFLASTFPATITLDGTQLDIPSTPGLFIDASNLSAPVTISGGENSRVFNIPATATMAMHSVRITGGFSGDNGGGILNDGTCTIIATTLSGNVASISGGGIFNAGTCAVISSTLSGNSAFGFGDGGGISNAGTLVITSSTLSGNSTSFGGGIYNFGTLAITSSTLSGNGASFDGGGILNDGTLALNHSIVTSNTPANLSGSAPTGSQNLTSGNPLLAPLGDYGGPTQTMPPLPGSPAIDAAGPLAEVQTITISPPVNFTLTFQGATTGAITGTPPTAGAVQSALTSLSTIGAGNVQVTSAPGGGLNTVFTVTFTGSLGGANQPPITGAGSSFSVATVQDGHPGSLTLTDQRGFPRPRDGDGNGTALADIGAVESAIRFVTNNSNSGPGSLRQAVLDAAAAPGWEAIAFVPALDAGTIPLTSTDPLNDISGIVITDTDGVAIAASSLPGGLTITKPAGDYRLFRVAFGARLSLHHLTLTGGSLTSDFGGAIRNSRGTLSLSDCTLTGNTAVDGGAIFSDSEFISTGRFTEVRRCTLTGNRATTGIGGAIRNFFGKTTVLFSTISGNTAPGTSGGGIASYGATETLTEVTSSIISGNTGGDVVFTDQATNTLLSRGHNFIGTGNGSPNFNQTGDVVTTAAPLLAPLADYGGPTRTMPPLPDSLAIDAGASGSRSKDQRGLPIVGFPDIGAAEYQGTTDLRLFWETDGDGDGNPFGVEHALGTNPALSDPANARNLSGPVFTTPGQASLTFGRDLSATPGTISVLKRSTDLIVFTEIFRITGNITSTGQGISAIVNTDSIIITDQNPPPGKAFYRIEAVSP